MINIQSIHFSFNLIEYKRMDTIYAPLNMLPIDIEAL